jgi:hypothetical protein
MVAVHQTAPFDLEWRDPERDHLQHKTINLHEMQVAPSDLPVFHCWTPTARALVIALDRQFVAHTFVQAFEHDPEALPVLVWVADSTVQRAGGTLRARDS